VYSLDAEPVAVLRSEQRPGICFGSSAAMARGERGARERGSSAAPGWLGWAFRLGTAVDLEEQSLRSPSPFSGDHPIPLTQSQSGKREASPAARRGALFSGSSRLHNEAARLSGQGAAAAGAGEKVRAKEGVKRGSACRGRKRVRTVNGPPRGGFPHSNPANESRQGGGRADERKHLLLSRGALLFQKLARSRAFPRRLSSLW